MFSAPPRFGRGYVAAADGRGGWEPRTVARLLTGSDLPGAGVLVFNAAGAASTTLTPSLSEIVAATSSGLVIKNLSGTAVATIGAGPGTGTTLAGGLNITGALAGVTTLSASDDVTVSGSDAAAITLQVRNTNAGTGAFARIQVQADGAPTVNLDQFSGAYTGTGWGLTLAGYAVLSASSALSAGVIFGHFSNKPVIFGIGSAEVARLTGGTLASDRLDVKYTTASTSTTTGALTVAGGAGVAGRVSATEFASGATKVVGAQGAAVADATGGATVDAEARAAINALLARIRTHGLIAT